jgi:hypothetical protein
MVEVFLDCRSSELSDFEARLITDGVKGRWGMQEYVPVQQGPDSGGRRERRKDATYWENGHHGGNPSLLGEGGGMYMPYIPSTLLEEGSPNGSNPSGDCFHDRQTLPNQGFGT